MESIHDYVYQPGVLDFVKLSKNFTSLVSSSFEGTRKEFVRKLLILMPAMYANFQKLSLNEPIFEGENEKFVGEEDWSSVFQNVAGNLGSQNEYLDVPEDEEYDRLELISRSLSEDIADVYQDIRDFLELYRNGNEEIMNDAIWECRMNMQNYWGKKLLRASVNLHRILYTEDEILEEKDREWEEKHVNREFNTDEWFISRKQKEDE